MDNRTKEIVEILEEAKRRAELIHGYSSIDKINEAISIITAEPNPCVKKAKDSDDKYECIKAFERAHGVQLKSIPNKLLYRDELETWETAWEASRVSDKRVEELQKEIEEGDYWMKRATAFYENGGCPACFATDEDGHTKKCEFGHTEKRIEELRAQVIRAKETIEEVAAQRNRALENVEMLMEKMYEINNNRPVLMHDLNGCEVLVLPIDKNPVTIAQKAIMATCQKQVEAIPMPGEAPPVVASKK